MRRFLARISSRPQSRRLLVRVPIALVLLAKRAYERRSRLACAQKSDERSEQIGNRHASVPAVCACRIKEYAAQTVDIAVINAR